MDPIIGSAVGKMIAAGGGYLLGAIMLALYLYERRASSKMADKAIQMATDQTAAAVRQVDVLRRVEETLKEVARRI